MMPRKSPFQWRIDLPGGEVLFVDKLDAARPRRRTEAGTLVASPLVRAGAGVYYTVETYESAAGVRPYLTVVTRVKRVTAAGAIMSESLPFESAPAMIAAYGKTDGV